jgi:HlyD family secretion protein
MLRGSEVRSVSGQEVGSVVQDQYDQETGSTTVRSRSDPALQEIEPRPRAAVAPAIIVALLIGSIVSTTAWFLMVPQPLIIQGEADATRIDIAARVDGKVAKRPVERGDNVDKGQLLYQIANPELLTKLAEEKAAKVSAEASLANIDAGTRQEIISQRSAAVEAARANAVLAQQTYDRTKQIVSAGSAPIQRLDDATNSLVVARRAGEQAKLAYEEAVNGYTKEQREIAAAAVSQAQAAIDTVQAQVDELNVFAPVKAQVYQIGAESGEYVSPGVPLLSLVDLSDVWLTFDLREDLVKGLKVGDRFKAKVPALGDREIEAVVKVIATKGEYADWRATRATGDFDLRTFEVRAYPDPPLPELRPGMSVYAVPPGEQK